MRNKWFTLIEIILWVTISMIIMMSIGVFVVSGISQITFQKSLIEQEDMSRWFFYTLQDILQKDGKIITDTSTGFVFQTNGISLWSPMIYEIAPYTMTWVCSNDMDKTSTGIEIKNYHPFILNSWDYSGSFLQHHIYENGSKIIGWNWFWDNFYPSISGTQALLNSPGGLASYWNSWVFLSDTGNNRILYYSNVEDGSKGTLVEVLWQADGLYMPTGLWYDDNALYILNTGNHELLKLSSKSATATGIDIHFKLDENIPFKKVELSIQPHFSIWGSYSTGSFNWSGVNTSTWDTVTSSSTGITYSFSWTQALNNWGDFSLKIATFTGSFDDVGAFYTSLKFISSTNSIVYEKLFPYALNSDTQLDTFWDNILEVLNNEDLEDGVYTDIAINSMTSTISLFNYLENSTISLDLNGVLIHTWTTLPTTFETLTTRYNIKLKDIQVSYDDEGLLSLILEYYTYFDCEDASRNITKTLLWKKFIPK